MQNAVFGIFSLGSYILLAIFQTGYGDLAVFKDIGMGGAFILTCFFMFKYFKEQIERKDAEHAELTKEFIRLVEKTIATDSAGVETNRQVVQELAELKKKL